MHSQSQVEVDRKVPIIYTSSHGLQLALVCLVELGLGYYNLELVLSILHYSAFIDSVHIGIKAVENIGG